MVFAMSRALIAAVPRFLEAVRILPRRLLIDTPNVAATVPMLRGVWGAALHDLAPRSYEAVFDPPVPNAVPLYLTRPAPPTTETQTALDWFLLGSALAHDEPLRRAWDIASGRGLGKERLPFYVRRFLDLAPDGNPGAAGSWTLAAAVWPLAPSEPCLLLFPAPLRILHRKHLIEAPTLVDLTMATARRVLKFLPDDLQGIWEALTPELVELAAQQPAGTWQGRRLDLHRYSGRQRAEIDLPGVSGELELPAGPGPLAPLLAAAQWLHLGKGTVFGLGQLIVQAVGTGPVSFIS